MEYYTNLWKGHVFHIISEVDEDSEELSSPSDSQSPVAPVESSDEEDYITEQESASMSSTIFNVETMIQTNYYFVSASPNSQYQLIAEASEAMSNPSAGDRPVTPSQRERHVQRVAHTAPPGMRPHPPPSKAQSRDPLATISRTPWPASPSPSSAATARRASNSGKSQGPTTEQPTTVAMAAEDVEEVREAISRLTINGGDTTTTEPSNCEYHVKHGVLKSPSDVVTKRFLEELVEKLCAKMGRRLSANDKVSHIYLFQGTDFPDRVKIGRSKRPETRLTQIADGCKMEGLRLLHVEELFGLGQGG
ncbi:uncharacterized protein LTHEOB_11876 [Lasiodiplodia theobromae]|uniref:uncharacterized protein n=1 Tax=Lasiodiplodia theobromae TaxID=45133 RepID=UPI0015C3B969|nr:uncharacterized protein LTHEOB_11876 [Lasiodiplodia theobromae]KAF4536869.1 hypothetical protein LTHEOB_11876 [Lasiodiplodia theobromae]